ncbi:Reverse transcriptase (RNA-dependent DNA polymerase) [Rhizoctonia solani]|uniref:Reverse transcriptase (RNA-dependent DNA polymerase) n=1 Tax=Rhizoctonia solani TaxID=456999 RepID=A0A8H7I2R1_9AGAM|nr:Reverse transcriptase (RNA-dependent DNA polymerase) [Rhizoctonia solani]
MQLDQVIPQQPHCSVPHRQPPMPPLPAPASSIDPQAHSFAYINNFTILTYSPLHQDNVLIMSNIIKNINQTAIKLGLEFKLPKSDLIHFIRSSCTPHSNPSLTFSHLGTDTVISPKDVVRWLGFFLDRRLNFKEHIQTMAIKAKATMAGLRMLANSQNGLSVRHARILFKASVTPILTYGLPLWFHGRRQLSLLEPLRKVQNQGLRWILGAFRTTPTRCMEHLASIPPLHIACLRIVENLASKLKSIPARAELARRLPPDWDSSAEPQHVTKSPISFAASLSHPDTEFISPYLVHPSAPNNPWPEQLEIDGKSPGPSKKAAAKIIQNEIDLAESNASGNIIHSFSDGHAGALNGIPKANIYDAEMLGIALCLGRSVQIAKQVQANRIVIYCDNQAAVKSISSLQQHPAQYATRIFHQHARSFLENNPARHVIVKWLPGHSKIAGNEPADEAAKGSESLRPTPVFNRTITWSKTNATKRAARDWRKVWDTHTTTRPDSGTYIPRPPSLKLHPIFNRPTYPRNVQCRLVQFLTGHGFYGPTALVFTHTSTRSVHAANRLKRPNTCSCSVRIRKNTGTSLLIFHLNAPGRRFSEHCRDWRQYLSSYSSRESGSVEIRRQPLNLVGLTPTYIRPVQGSYHTTVVLTTAPYAHTAAPPPVLKTHRFHALMAPVFGPRGHPVLTTSLLRFSSPFLVVLSLSFFA